LQVGYVDRKTGLGEVRASGGGRKKIAVEKPAIFPSAETNLIKTARFGERRAAVPDLVAGVELPGVFIYLNHSIVHGENANSIVVNPMSAPDTTRDYI